MNKTLSKAVMKRSRLRNRYLRNPNVSNHKNYKKQRSYCVHLFKREKKTYYENLDTKKYTNNTFWKAIKPLFSEKQIYHNKITLVDNEKIISNDAHLADTFNTYFSNIVAELNNNGYEAEDDHLPKNDYISNIIYKYRNHPIIHKIKEKVMDGDSFTFSLSSGREIASQINSLNRKKPSTFNNIPTKILIDTSDVSTPLITKIYNNSIISNKFPSQLKLLQFIKRMTKPIIDLLTYYLLFQFIKRMTKPIINLLAYYLLFQKYLERSMHHQILEYINKYLSPYLCGFRKGYSTQHWLTVMIERWKSALDKNKIAGALITDISKAFNCLNHELLIAKLDAYAFSKTSLALISSCLSERKQRTKIYNTFSSWCDIIFGVPQGSILGPLLINIYINDIFYFVDNNIANYADDNTPYATEKRLLRLFKCLKTMH